MAYDFEAGNSTDRIAYADNANLDMTSAMSISVLVKIESYPATTQVIVTKAFQDSRQGNYELWADNTSGGRIIFYWWNASNILRLVAKTGLTTGAWHNIVVTVTGDDISKLYFDGVDQAVTPSGSSSFTRNLTSGLYVGNSEASAWRFDGIIAEVGIWNVAIDAAEAVSLSKYFAPPLIRPASLKFYAPLVRSANDKRTGLAGTVA